MRLTVEQRLRDGPASHMEVFASVRLSLLTVLALLCRVVQEPAQVLPGHVECLSLLVSVVEFLHSGDAAGTWAELALAAGPDAL